MKEYKIKSKIFIDRNVVHAVITHLFGKNTKIKYKVNFIGNLIFLKTEEKIPKYFSYKFGSNINQLNVISFKDVDLNFDENKTYEIEGIISYSKTLTKPILNSQGEKIRKKRIVSFYAEKNNYIEDEELLLKFISERIGINPENIIVRPLGLLEISKNKKIYDAFELCVRGKIVDKEVFKNLLINKIGSAGSYGFGSMRIR